MNGPKRIQPLPVIRRVKRKRRKANRTARQTRAAQRRRGN